jgi:superfamily II DNA helicase RecQ
VLKYKDTELQMDHIPTLLVSEYRECRRYLYDDLMFGTKTFRHIHAAALKDSMDVDTVGWNFRQHRDNKVLLEGSTRILLSAVEQSEPLCKLFLTQGSGEHGIITWRESALASYEATVQAFLERWAVLAHIEGGPPLRESELFSITWNNTQRQRSIYIHLKRVMIHTTYDKSQQQKGRFRDNIRFLSDHVADLLLDYLVYVIPLRQIFLRHSSPKALLSSYLWSKDGKVWPDNKLTRCLEAASDRAQIPRLHISNWRQMTVAIVKTKFASQIGVFEVDADDEDAEEIEQDIRILTKMRNHKVRTANRAYANQNGANFGNVWDGLIRMGLRASTLWQDFWGVDVILRNRKRPAVDLATPSLSKRIAMGVYRPRKPWSTEALLGGVRELYRNEMMEWKSPEQEQALVLIMTWTEQVVVVLPTGAGKSLLFMLPCSLPGAGITILVVPLVSLRSDLLRRLTELRIEHMVWLPGERRETPLVMVTVEAAATADFRAYAQGLIDQQKLDRIVVDECHLTVTAATYRESIVDLTAIRLLRTQFVYLTATLPPSMQAEFEERNYLVHPKIIRAPSNRPNIFYAVRKARTGRGSLLEQAAAEARRMISHTDLFDRSRDKIVLYTQTRNEADHLADLIGCAVYTAKSGTTEEKNEALETWTRSCSQPCIVATAALAEGFDYAHVRMVINVNEPESIVLFAQESGRAGRDGQLAYSLVLLPSNWKTAVDATDRVEECCLPATRDSGLRRQRERRAMQRYLRQEQCFRTSLSEHLDDPGNRRWCMTYDVPCAVCTASHDVPIGLVVPKNENPSHQSHTGAPAIHRARLAEQTELTRYVEDLVAIRGSCCLCRATGQQWDHPFSSCDGRFDVFRQRDEARRRHQERGREWLQPYSACFWCWNPQSVCPRADPEANK